ncbi:LysM peptidoglycan-binding domain-containing protein [Metaplanococcus flavidus]|uniref:LysM peptidoglycan-binding domain-containing protein n=1 Tax=Metaplanococcus flavidus TaxID=569883 RepID=A0ABW3L9V4_9BACL
MDKRNYRESLEKDRQEINAENTSTLSRRAHRQPGKKKAPKRKNFLLPGLFFIFILIPVSILIYVAFFYVPDDTLIGAENENEVSFEQTSPSEKSEVLVPEETEDENTERSEETADEEQTVEADEKTEEKTEETVEEEPVEEATEPAETEKPVEQETPAAAPEEPAEEVTSDVKTVIVKEQETLYRIAVNNYGASGAGAAVEKIKQANNLSSNEIYPGQTLILP